MGSVQRCRRRILFGLLCVIQTALGSRAATAYPVWEQFVATNPSPGGREQHAAIYDPVNDRMIIFGGASASGDTWAFSPNYPNLWQSLSVGTPGGRRGASAVYDPVRKRMILFGGYNGAWLNDVWALPLDPPGPWTQLSTSGSPPTTRMLTPLVYDPVRDRVLLFGGWSGTQPLSDTWALSLAGTPQWTQLGSSNPPARFGHLAFYDPTGDRLVVLTGSNGSDLADVWALALGSGNAWSPITPAGVAPVGRYYSAGAFIPEQSRFVFYGGQHSGALGDLWFLDLAPTPSWTNVANAGVQPPSLYLHSAVYDPHRSRVLFYGAASATVHALHMNDVGSPFVSGFSVQAARVGDPIEIRGWSLTDVDSVMFTGGVLATIEQRSFSSINVHVPAGARTGPVRVAGPSGSAQSLQSLYIGDLPAIESVSPDSGRSGDEIVIRGHNFLQTSAVTFGPASHATFVVSGDTLIRAVVDLEASEGPISITNPIGVGHSATNFRVIQPVINARIVSVRDVRGDQGGHVSVKWLGSDFDLPTRGGIARYRIWRRAPLDAAAAHPAELRRIGPAGYWENIGEVPAIRIRGYAFTASTPTDSSADDNPYTAFFVETVTDTAGVFYLSPVDSGYSVDNLAPMAPSQFRVDYSGMANVLRWTRGREADLREYGVYRGTSVTFPTDGEHLLMTTRDTTVSASPGNWHYKLVAIDVHGNRSRPVLVSPDAPVATVAALVLSQALTDRVRLTWYADGLQGASMVLERRAADGPWLSVATLSVDGEGYLRHEDLDVEAGGSYGYRLVYTEDGVETRTPETRVRMPGLSLAIEQIAPNPTAVGSLRVAFRLASDAAGQLEVLDVLGRRWAAHRIEAGSPARSTWRPTAGARWPAGLYLVRLTQGSETRTARFVVVE